MKRPYHRKTVAVGAVSEGEMGRANKVSKLLRKHPEGKKSVAPVVGKQAREGREVRDETFVSKTLTPIRKIVAAGRGRVIQSPPVKAAILNLCKKPNPHVLYLGTATYEQQSGYDLQAAGFLESGCTVQHLKLTGIRKTNESTRTIQDAFTHADIIAVSGGNTLFAMKQWRKLGVDTLLRQACDNGKVLCGGSAGAICWFDGGHSDSRDPTTLLHVNPK